VINGVPLYKRYHIPKEKRPKHTPADPKGTSRIGWRTILDNWDMVVADLLETGVDLWDPALADRPWLWLRTAVFALFDKPHTRMHQVAFGD